MMQTMKREYVMKKLVELTNVCSIIISLAIMMTVPAHALTVNTSPFMKADIDHVAGSSHSSGTENHNSTFSRIQKDRTSAAPFVIDDTIPVMRALWLPAGSKLLILEVPIIEPSASSGETDAAGALHIYNE